MKKLADGYWLGSDLTVYKEARNLLKFTDNDGIERLAWEVKDEEKVTKILKDNLEREKVEVVYESTQDVMDVDLPQII